MKITTYVVCLCLSVLALLTGCLDGEYIAPTYDADRVKLYVQGHWAIAKVNSELCRENSCTTSTSTGSPYEYFAFKADSATLVRSASAPGSFTCDRYKAEYSGSTILVSNGSRTERFEVLELSPRKLVLKSVFTGRDPAAVFTDTYFLYR